MGGDDLDDEEDTMWMKPVRSETTRGGGGGDDLDTDDYHDNEEDGDTNAKKRRPADDNDDDNDDDMDPNKTEKESMNELSSSSSKKRQKKSKASSSSANYHNHSNKNNPTPLLLQVGRTIHEQSSVEQANYLTTAIRHYSLLSAASSSSSSSSLSDNDVTNTVTILPHQCGIDSTLTPSSTQPTPITTTTIGWSTCRQVVSMKTLRDWNHVGSPCVVVICVSARRAVSLLKEEMSCFKVRTGKFFPKNGSIQDQQQQLATTVFPIVIGTPHRLRQLSTTASHSNNNNNNDNKNTIGTRPLNWDATQLVIIDNYQMPHKQYTVCTLPDTASDCMMLLKEQVYPQLVPASTMTNHRKSTKRKAKGCRIVFLK